MASSDDENEAWVPLSERAEYQDLQPLDLPAGLGPVVEIKYTVKVKEVFGYFRAIRAAKELSPRALELTKEVIYVNSADYTAWAYRWQCIEHLGSLEDEMPFINDMASRSPKNYQLWNHRRRVAFKRGASHAQQELAYAAECLAQDAKNYHAWAHRQAVVKQFGLWQQELEVTTELLKEDVRNNSAWNQRFFVVSNCPELRNNPEMSKRELRFCLDNIKSCPHNESAWSYARGILQLTDARQRESAALALCELCIKVAQATSCPPAMAMLVFALKEAGAYGKQSGTALQQQCRHVLAQLQDADPLRQRYWTLLQQQNAASSPAG